MTHDPFHCLCGCNKGCDCPRCKPRVDGRWSQLIRAGPNSPVHVIGIERSNNGSWLAFTGRIDDTLNRDTRSGRFDSFAEACAFIGYVDGLPKPSGLEAIGLPLVLQESR